MTRPHAARVAAWVLTAVGTGLLIFGVVRLVDDDSGSGSGTPPSPASTVGPGPGSSARPAGSGGLDAALLAAEPAEPPFEGSTETTVMVGSERVRVVIADAEAERERGLRERSSLAPYGGMLFVFPASTSVAFTMSTVPVALDIGFYDESGAVVDRLRMEPCPGTDTTCPVYRARAPFRYALETLASDLPDGPLAPAAGGASGSAGGE